MWGTTTTLLRQRPITSLHGRTGACLSTTRPSRMPSPTRSQRAVVELQLQLLRLHQPRQLLAHQDGQRAPTCQVSAFAWLEFISQLTGSFMLWAGAVLMQPAVISLIRLNMTPAVTAGLPKALLTPTTR